MVSRAGDITLLQQTDQDQYSHHYYIGVATTCSANDALNSYKAPGVSAPGAPAAKEGFTTPIDLDYIESPNQISQLVDSPSGTIVNTTLPGHAFFPGNVVINVSPSGSGSTIQINGQGTSSNWWGPIVNDVVGYLFFGFEAVATEFGCDAANGIPNAG